MDMPVARSWDPALDFLERRSSYRITASTRHTPTRRLTPTTRTLTHKPHSSHSHAHAHPPPHPSSSPPSRMWRGSGEPAKQLACSSCRKKKIKCQPNVDGGRCRACLRSGAECLIPVVDERKLSNSKKLVRELYAKIASLEAELQRRPKASDIRDRDPRRDSFHHIIGVLDDDDRTKTLPEDEPLMLCLPENRINAIHPSASSNAPPMGMLVSTPTLAAIIARDRHRP
ncbi:hypothetical protein Sste5346_006390 [Sporothrix stenoceras]|uniref:Zn(2)-C6 fungal-type domain-containing protein n=1 Tax=Sporothrix stenoceras TaxID=5173 RepID=A0ABR3YYT5_9PEZI